MIVHEHPSVISMGINGSFKLVAFGDVHWGSKDCAEERFERIVLKEFAQDPNAYFVGTGDIVDAIVASDQKRFRLSALKASFFSREDIIDASIDEFASLWEKYKIPRERIIGFASGNHHDAILKRNGTDITERLCYRLKVKNLGYSAFVRVKTTVGTSGWRLPFVFYVHHGFGGATRTDGGSVTKYVRHAFRYQGASLYLYGHDHQKWAKRIAIVEPDFNHLRAQDSSIVVASCGSFHRTVSHDQTPSYSEVAGYNPSEMGCIIATIKHMHSQKTENKQRRTRQWLEVSASE